MSTLSDAVLRGRPLRITEYGEPILHARCRPVTEFGTPELATLIDDMFTTMHVAHGCGLAANQVGVALRLFVYDLVDEDDVRHVGHVINPTLRIHDGRGEVLLDAGEGCLSIPGGEADLARPARADVTGVDQFGEPVSLSAEGYFARCLQHECQHLDGRLYVDHLSPRARRRVLAQSVELRSEVLDLRTARSLELDKEPAVYPAADDQVTANR